jgi:O-antigen/teichoic acid export membrane protein
MLPAAFATSLLPRLSGEPCAAARVDLARAVQRRCFGATAAGAGIVGAASPWLLPFVFGARFAQLGPLWILLATAPMIGVAGVLGALLIAEDRRSGLAAQVLSALTLNALVSLVLITSFGAVGAALATFLTEGYSLLLLALLVRHSARVPATQPAQTSPVYAR